ncbi:MAG: tetraacyldisaccharide 4'-kinase [Bacteroidota bacterium]
MSGLWSLLLPFSVLYGWGMMVRNKLYDWGMLQAESFDLPVICIGNLSVGGTGKTPHVEYLINLYGKKYKIAILSRGYKRKTKGFHLASDEESVDTLGDEPLQYHTKFKNTIVAVDEDRRNGIHQLLRLHPDLDVIILDDAFQHRAVKAGINILLSDYHKPFFEDWILPAGRLRESRKGAERADLIVVTKTPKIFSPITKRTYKEQINPRPDQPLFFSYLCFGEPVAMNASARLFKRKNFDGILMLTGIANPLPLENYLQNQCQELSTLIFPDHHQYTSADMAKLRESFNKVFSGNKAIMTTEKDAMRLRDPELAKDLIDLPIYYIPVEVEFHPVDKELFDRRMMEFVGKRLAVRR